MCRNLAEVVYYEARSEPEEGKLAVAFVVLNRINHPNRWGETVKAVISQPWQFTYRWNGSMRNGFKEVGAYNKILELSFDILSGKKENPIGLADHYKTLDAKPKWDYSKLTQVAIIGNHIFYQHK